MRNVIRSAARSFEFRLFASLLVALAALSATQYAEAATTFDASVTSANGELSTALTWSSDMQACVASGHPAWTGAKPSSGTLTLPTITMSGTYTLTIVCETPGTSTAVLTWTLPTTNTDGSPLTNLAGTRLAWGNAANALSFSHTVEGFATTHTIEGLAPGSWFFGAKAYNSAGVESSLSSLVSKITTAGSNESDSVTLTVNPIPGEPTNLAVE